MCLHFELIKVLKITFCNHFVVFYLIYIKKERPKHHFFLKLFANTAKSFYLCSVKRNQAVLIDNNIIRKNRF